MNQSIDWDKLTKELLGTPVRSQVLLVHEARRDFARELVLAMNALGQQGADSSVILQAVIHSCEAELMRADAP